MQETIGVVVPVYNVEKYLRVCLDSILNQSYKNLVVILVNDGSTDKNSRNIAKEYVEKYSNFILIDKPNLGLSSARNVGIEYFQGKYELQHEAQIENLLCYKVSANHYNVTAIHKNINSNKQIEQISHITFLDSDDWWDKECMQESVNALHKAKDTNTKVDIVWYDNAFYFDGIKEFELVFGLHTYDFGHTEMIMTQQEFVKEMFKTIHLWFAWAWMGIIDFKFLCDIHLKFYDKILHEDTLFGTLLFAHASEIYILPKKLYNYRIRSNSLCSFETKNNKAPSVESIPHYARNILQACNGDVIKARIYYRSSSMFISFLQLKKFIETNPNKPASKLIKDKFMQGYVIESLKLLDFDCDPLDLIKEFPNLKGYVTMRISSTTRLAINNPELYKKLLPLIRIYKKFTQIERTIRKKFKKKKQIKSDSKK